jgi:hypothetical protein
VGVHFAKEEELVFPLLGLFQSSVEEKTDKGIEALGLINNMNDNLVTMYDEHKREVNALKSLIEAKSENRPEYLRLCVKLLLHIRVEKEFIYPTAILIGKYLKIKKKNMLEISDFSITK